MSRRHSTALMKAVVIDRCCRAEELQVSEIPVPQVCPGRVLVKVHAAGLNHSEALLRMYEADRDYIATPVVPGIECAGEVADASDSPLTKGQKVIALMGGMGRSFNGSYAEYALLPARNVFPVDTDLDWVALAAIPETYYTAWGSLFENLRLTAKDTLLVRGATSSVGQAAIQLARAAGARVIATSRRPAAFGLLESIGANECAVDDGCLCRQKWRVRPDKILELIGPRTLADSLRTVGRPGRVCCTGVLGEEYAVHRFDPIKDIPNGVQLSGFYSNYPTAESIGNMFSFIRNAGIRPLYSKVFSLDRIVEAHRLLESGGAGGKIILKID